MACMAFQFFGSVLAAIVDICCWWALTESSHVQLDGNFLHAHPTLQGVPHLSCLKDSLLRPKQEKTRLPLGVEARASLKCRRLIPCGAKLGPTDKGRQWLILFFSLFQFIFHEISQRMFPLKQTVTLSSQLDKNPHIASPAFYVPLPLFLTSAPWVFHFLIDAQSLCFRAWCLGAKMRHSISLMLPLCLSLEPACSCPRTFVPAVLPAPRLPAIQTFSQILAPHKTSSHC